MRLPNILTISRVILVPIFLWMIFQNTMMTRWLAFLIFIVAALTDYYDGWAARKFHMTSNFGKIFDPVADKILVSSALIVFVIFDIIPLWMVVIILSREFLVTSFRLVALSYHQVLAAQRSGKQKTVSQMVAILVTLFVMSLVTTIEQDAEWNQWLQGGSFFAAGVSSLINHGPYVLMLIATLISITSAVDFILKNKQLLRKIS